MLNSMLKWSARTALAGLAVLVLLYFFPGLTLLARRPKVSTPFCSAWKIVLDANWKTRVSRRGQEIKKQCRMVSRDGRLALWETPYGRWWILGDNDEILPSLLQQQEEGIYGPVRQGDVVLDCGAHVGTFTRKALQGGARLVVAIEPSPDALQCLRRNLETEIAGGRVLVYPKGVWDSTTELPFFVNGNGDAANSFVTRFGQAAVIGRVPVSTIDAIVRELRIDRVTLIKMDIKGATERALQGASETIHSFHPRFALSTEDPPENVWNIMATLKPGGYGFAAGPCLVEKNEVRTSVLFAQ